MQRLVIRHEWAPGARISADPEQAAAQLAQRDGAVLLAAVVEASRDPAAPLHAAFEWHDPTAAHLFGLGQAGHVVRCLRRVTVDVRTEEEQPAERVYVPLTRVPAEDGAPAASATYVPVALARVGRLAAELRALAACADIAEDLAALVEKYG